MGVLCMIVPVSGISEIIRDCSMLNEILFFHMPDKVSR
jgi:hypothetical protein